MHDYARAALAQRQQGPQVEWPDDGELEAWRSTADDLLKTSSPSGPTLRRAAHLLQNAYLFASSASPQAPAQPSAAAPGAQAEPQGELCFVKNEAGQIVAVTRCDADGRILETIAESAQAEPHMPLTEEQILACVQSIGLPKPMGLTVDRGPYEVTEPSYYLQLLVRAIERAHGIGKQDGT